MLNIDINVEYVYSFNAIYYTIAITSELIDSVVKVVVEDRHSHDIKILQKYGIS